MAEFSGQIPFFLDNFLGKPAGALPKGAQWVLTFDGAYISGNEAGYKEVLPVHAIKKCIDFEPRKWEVERAMNTTLIDSFQKTKGCMFVQAVSIPGESTAVNPEGIQTNGFIRTTVGGGRDDYSGLQIVFLETNISFVDNVIRPWVIATSHLGMIARKGLDNYRCNISVYKLGVSDANTKPHILQKFTFYGACPISVSGEEYNYGPSNSPVNRETTFSYHFYNVENLQNQNLTLVRAHYNEQIPVPLSTPIKGVNAVVARATLG
jgi:hypothetical protein